MRNNVSIIDLRTKQGPQAAKKQAVCRAMCVMTAELKYISETKKFYFFSTI